MNLHNSQRRLDLARFAILSLLASAFAESWSPVLKYRIPIVLMLPLCLSVSAADPDYARDIQPILAGKCYACHGPDENKRKSDLRFDVMEDAIEYGAVTPGDPSDSLLVDQIMTDDPETIMPPPESKMVLDDREKQLLIDWIQTGAEFSPHWAFQPIASVKPPRLSGSAQWARDPIDAFILQRLQAEKIAPSSEADRETLIRRVTFDLTGLPPTVEEVDTFLADASPSAYDELVERLLASPRYGEHMATFWLDIARYADTFGYQSDVENHVWPWREWVIRSFNNNLPYDQFITHQLAGDLLPNATQDQKLATAFNRLHRQTNEGGSIEEEFHVEYVADRTETYGTAFLGLTLECSKCHDHKFDPLTQAEFYQFTSFFNDIDESGLYSHFTQTPPTPAMFLYDDESREKHRQLKADAMEMEAKIATEREAARARYRAWLTDENRAFPLPAPTVYLSFDNGAPEGKIANEVNSEKPATREGEFLPVEGVANGAVAFTGWNGVNLKGYGFFERHDPFSMAFSFYMEKHVPHAVVVHRSKAASDAASRGYEILLEEGRPVFSLIHFWPGNGIRIVSQDAIPEGEWVHLAVTYDGSSRAASARIYVNGKPVAVEVIRDTLDRTIRYGNSADDPPLTIGSRFRDFGIKGGRVDEFQVFDRELTALELSAIAGQADVADLARNATDSDELFDYYLHAVDKKYSDALTALHTAREAESKFAESVRQIMVMEDMPESRPAYVLGRGAYTDRGDAVDSDTPSWLLPLSSDAPRNRLGLAQWTTHPDNPLTARVTVNRFWQQVFGRGLVATPEDFGIQGDSPSHPELLDYVARSFQESGWDVKGLMRRMVSTATYRQSSASRPELMERDPENELLARGPRFRRSAEEIRDTALAASGLLVDTVGGPSVKPYQPDGLWRDSASQTYKAGTGDALYRRSMYTYIKRTVPPPSMITFDAPSRDVCVARRERTATPLQALVLLNDPQYVEAARVLADKALASNDNSDTKPLIYIFRALTSRHPRPEELGILLRLYKEQRDWFETQPEQAEAYVTVGESSREDDTPLSDIAAMTAVAQAVMNFDEYQVKK